MFYLLNGVLCIACVFLMYSAGWRWLHVQYGMFVGLSISGVFIGAPRSSYELGVGVRGIQGVPAPRHC